jgi:hypothetical protein
LLQITWTAPHFSIVASRSAHIDSYDVTSLATPMRSSEPISCTAFLQRAVEHVGEHHLHALFEHRHADRLADAAGTTRDDADLAVEILHWCSPLVGCEC